MDRPFDIDTDWVIRIAREALTEAFTPGADVRPPSENARTGHHRACVTIRHAGRVRACWSGFGSSLEDAIGTAARNAAVDRRRGPSITRAELRQANLEVWIQVARETLERITDDHLWGGVGFDLELEGRRAFFLPSVPIESRISDPGDLLDRLFRKAGLGSSAVRSNARVFGTRWTHVVEVDPTGARSACLYHRLAPAASGQKLDDLERAILAGNHLLSIQQADGGYLYQRNALAAAEPLKGGPSAVRFIGCSVAVARLARAVAPVNGTTQAARFAAVAAKGEDWLAARLQETRIGLAVEEGPQSAPLGAAAFALLLQDGLPPSGPRAERSQRLVGTLLAAQREDGSFPANLAAVERPGRPDFGPGQALLALALHGGDGFENQTCFASAHRHYASFELDGVSPFFLAWQAKAWSVIGARSGEDHYATFAFRLLERIAELQVREGEFRGGYAVNVTPYVHRPPSFLTALFTEAALMGWHLAISRGDKDRASSLEHDARDGLAFLGRLQLTDDMAHLFPEPTTVIGGIRKDPASFEMRCDYTMHALTCLCAAMSVGFEGRP